MDHTDDENVEYIVANGGERQTTRPQHQCTAVLDEQSSEPRVNMYKGPSIEKTAILDQLSKKTKRISSFLSSLAKRRHTSSVHS